MLNNYPQILTVADGPPFDKKTWSGSSFSLNTELKNQGVLAGAIDANPSFIRNKIDQILSFSYPLEKWKFKYHLNTVHYRSMTRLAQQKIRKFSRPYSHLLLNACYYNIQKDFLRQNQKLATYQDGNLALLLKSPQVKPRLKSDFVQNTLRWEYRLYSKCDYIFTFSNWLKSSFVNDFKISSSKIFTIGAGPNLPIITPPSQKEYSSNRILFIGIDFKRKGGQVLLEAFSIVRREMPDAVLTIIGPKLSLNDPNIECVGYLPSHSTNSIEQLRSFFQRASVFVMPSLYEPFGIAFLEAMANSLPCIGTDNCAIPEIISHGETGLLIRPGDHKGLAKAIITILSSRETMSFYGHNAFRRYESHFSWSSVGRKLLSIISEQ